MADLSSKKTSQGVLRIGTSGYQYDHWKRLFYPEELPKRRWFEHYLKHFDTVEINNTFYRLPQASTFDEWREQSPEGFCYALKFSRYGSHLKRLKDPAKSLDPFLAQAEHLATRLGPILVQLPPRWKVDPERLSGFLESTPNSRRWTVEFRDPSWLCEEIYQVLTKHYAALCLHDMIPNHPQRMTAGWTYLRFHGDRYAGAYSSQYLTAQAQRIREYLSGGIDVYAYFNNDAAGHAVHNALDLKRYCAASAT